MPKVKLDIIERLAAIDGDVRAQAEHHKEPVRSALLRVSDAIEHIRSAQDQRRLLDLAERNTAAKAAQQEAQELQEKE